MRLAGGVQGGPGVLPSQVQFFEKGAILYAPLLSLISVPIEVLNGPRWASSDRGEPYIRLRIRHLYGPLHLQLVLPIRLFCHWGHRGERGGRLLVVWERECLRFVPQVSHDLLGRILSKIGTSTDLELLQVLRGYLGKQLLLLDDVGLLSLAV
jgi:hypothetical protein